MPSSAAAGYADYIEGKLIVAMTTSVTTGVTLKIKQFNGVTPTWPTAAHRIKIVQRTATSTKVEKIGVAAGTSQSGQTVTLGTLTRALSLSDGTNFSGSAGTAQSFAASADVFITWDSHDAAQSAKLDLANTFTTHQLISSTNELRFADSATAVWDDGTNLSFKDSANATRTLSQLSSLSGTNDKVKVTSNDTTENYLLSKLAAGTGITISETNDGGDEDATIAAVNTVATGHTGLSTVTTGGLLVGAGASNMTIIGPGSSGQVPVSNGTTIAMGSTPSTSSVVRVSGASSGTLTNPTAVTAFDTHTEVITANTLIANVGYEFEGALDVTVGTAGTLNFAVMLGSTALVDMQFGNAAGSGQAYFKGFIVGTAAAGAAVAVRCACEAHFDEGGAGDQTAEYSTTNAATNGSLTLQFGFKFNTSNGGNSVVMTMCRISKMSTTPF